MVVVVWRKILFLSLVSTVAVGGSVLRGPDNVLGIVDEDVTLRCRSDKSQDVRWSFTPIDQTAPVGKSQFPGRDVSTSWSSGGHHSLTLAGVSFQNAGRYECRVVGASSEDGVDAAAAYVVVVADSPRCKHNVTTTGMPLTPHDVGLECSVMFLGRHNLTLEWLAPDSDVLTSRHYWSGDDVMPHVARLRLAVRSSTAWPGHNSSVYTCRASFGNTTAQFVDVASNAPRYRHNTCTVRLQAAAPSTVADDVASTLASVRQGHLDTTSSNLDVLAVRPASWELPLTVAMAVLSLILIVVVVVVAVVCARRGPVCVALPCAARRRRRRNDRETQASEDNWNSARCDIDNKNNNNNTDDAAAARSVEAKPLILLEIDGDDKRRGGKAVVDASYSSEAGGTVVFNVQAQDEPGQSLLPAGRACSDGAAAANARTLTDSPTRQGIASPGGIDNCTQPEGPQTCVRASSNVAGRRGDSSDNSSYSTDSSLSSAGLPPSLGDDSGSCPVRRDDAETTCTGVQENVDSDLPREESTVSTAHSARSSMIALHPESEDLVE